MRPFPITNGVDRDDKLGQWHFQWLTFEGKGQAHQPAKKIEHPRAIWRRPGVWRIGPEEAERAL